MSALLSIFLNNLAPIFLMAGAGALLGRFSQINPRSLSQVIFYIFSPCLLFTLLTTSKLGEGEVLRLMAFTAGTILLMGLLAWLAGRALRLPANQLAGLMLVSMFMNAGNYGLPVTLFAFGQAALGYASLYFATNSILAYTIGSVVASTGRVGLRPALAQLARIPALYALALAALFMNTGWPMPLFLERTTKILGDASIPCMLVLLGLQLHSANWRAYKLPIAIGGGLRLVVSPLLTLLLLPFAGLSGPAYPAMALESAMPAAVLNTMLATEFEAEPAYVSAVVFLTTVLSPLSLTPLLAYLGVGA